MPAIYAAIIASSFDVYIDLTIPSVLLRLISFLRRHGFTGTKLGCSEGGCGSCTVVVSSYDFESKKVVHNSVNACLAPACSVEGKSVTTIEGIGTVDKLHPVQERIAKYHGSQCGFCTPGIAMSLYAVLRNHPNATEHDIEEAFDGNLCRCTGYRSILDGAKTLAVRRCSESCSDGGVCKSPHGECKNPTRAADIEDLALANKAGDFPEALLKEYESNPTPKSYSFASGDFQWFHPVTVPELLEIMDEHPSAKIINGNTEVGIEVKFKNQRYTVLVSPVDILDLRRITVKEDGVEIGASATIAQIQSKLKELCVSLPSHQCRGFEAVLENSRWFAGNQIRNVAAISGNIVTASPISDLNPVLVSLGAVLTVQSLKGGVRRIPMGEFFLGYRKTALRPSEIVTSVYIPFTKENEYAAAYKQAKRKDDDIAIVNAGMTVSLEQSSGKWIVKDACLAYGGLGPTTLIAKQATQFLIGKAWDQELVDGISPVLLSDFPLAASAPGGQIEFRKLLAVSFFLKFNLLVCNALSPFESDLAVADREKSALKDIQRELSSGKQSFVEAPSSEIVGRSMMHTSALKQVTGNAVYIDDIPVVAGELAVALVLSTVAHGKILSVDANEALSLPGVVDFVTAKDMPGFGHDSSHGNPNWIGPVFKDEELFATEQVHFLGQTIGLILADTPMTAQLAAKLVKVEYEKLPNIFTIEEAIAASSFFPQAIRKMTTGAYLKGDDEVKKMQEGLCFVQGEARMSGQEHFYLESEFFVLERMADTYVAQASLVIPKKEDNEMEVYASTQHPSETQHMVAHVLGIPSSRVTVKVKRMGGGFGGKESRSVFLTCLLAVAAKKHMVPLRYMLTREEDMAVTGTRHPFLGKYRVGFTPDGKIICLELDIFNNGGYSMDLSIAVLERSITHSDNAYRIPNVRIVGKVCKTNLPTNTAFRGFGGPQGMMVVEQWMSHVIDELGLPGDHVRSINFYNNGDVTHFNMPLEDFHMDRVWWEAMATSDYNRRRDEVERFNSANKYRKRGIVLIPTKFGLAFTARFLNQAGALVHVYTDGSILVAHGGTEMGQGLHTKMVQVAAQAFGIPVTKVHLSETATNTVANTSATAASVSSDINGMAVLDACTQILNRLKPIREANPNAPWETIVQKAYFDRINLSANGFYKTPDLDYDWEKNTGRMFSYFTYGAACAEVEIDVLTGDHSVLRADIVMDIGTPINPAIDIGQIEGAFTQGQGWCTIEEPLISPSTGFLLTRGPGGYKIPGFRDVPVDMRVRIVKGSRNSRAVHSSKAVGEPPLFLGSSVFFAIREAVKAARLENGVTGHFRLDSPATSERIRVACLDRFTAMARTPLKDGEKPFACVA